MTKSITVPGRPYMRRRFWCSEVEGKLCPDYHRTRKTAAACAEKRIFSLLRIIAHQEWEAGRGWYSYPTPRAAQLLSLKPRACVRRVLRSRAAFLLPIGGLDDGQEAPDHA